MKDPTPQRLDERNLQAYRIIVSYACPWCHRALIARTFNGLGALQVTNVEPVMDEQGWRLSDGRHMTDVYRQLVPDYSARATVPLLIDESEGVIISHESGDIMRMFGQSNPELISKSPATYLSKHASAVDAMNALVQIGINEAFYRVGFAGSAELKNRAIQELTITLESLNNKLGEQTWLVEESGPMESDWRLWTSLVRYEPAYRPLFLGNAAPPLAAYIHLARFTDQLMNLPGAADTFRIDEVVAHYTARMRDLNVVPNKSDFSLRSVP